VTDTYADLQAVPAGTGEERQAVRGTPLRQTLVSLLQADFTTQRRNARAWWVSIALPVVLLLVLSAGKRASVFGSAELVMGLSIRLGLITISVFGYSLSVARDREMGVFQRLRVAPAPTWVIMFGRLVVHVAFILIMAIALLIVGGIFAHAALSPGAYPLTLAIVILGGLEFLGIG
jgi:ABC-2 type transport system permease protein